MVNIKADTNKMRNHGNEMMALATSIGNDFNLLFERLSNMPTRTFEWTGKSAETYARRSIQTKRQYMLIKDELFKRGQLLVAFAEMLEADIRVLRR